MVQLSLDVIKYFKVQNSLAWLEVEATFNRVVGFELSSKRWAKISEVKLVRQEEVRRDHMVTKGGNETQVSPVMLSLDRLVWEGVSDVG